MVMVDGWMVGEKINERPNDADADATMTACMHAMQADGRREVSIA